MLEILRNMWRRKFRTALTMFGIAIGIFAFTVMGSMALKFNKMIDGGKKYITGQITLMPKGSDFMTGTSGLLPVDTLNRIAKVSGVQAVEGSVGLSLDEPDPDNPTGGMTFSAPPTIYSVDLSSGFINRNWQTLDMKEGEPIDKMKNDKDIVIGSSVALDKGWHVGDTVKIRGRDFTVIGILDKTMTGPDSYVFMKLNVVRELYVASNPFLKSLKAEADKANKISATELAKLPPTIKAQMLKAQSFKIEDISTGASVSWNDGVDPDKLSETIKNEFKKEVLVLSPKKMGEQIDRASAIFNAIILGTALIALVVGGFSIINTMIMSISERTKEIGVKKAIGASGFAIAKEYTFEAGIIGFFGGVIGMLFGLIAIVAVNNKMASKGAEIFLVDRNFLIEVVAFAFILGIIAGLIPAWRAARLKVVTAIREL